MRFIGSKNRLLEFIKDNLTMRVGEKKCVVGDLFCGTASVSGLFKKLGHRVIANDNLQFCSLYAKSILMINDEPKFNGLEHYLSDAKVLKTDILDLTYDRVIHHLNTLAPKSGFIYREYSPEGSSPNGFERFFFSGKNAQKIDAIRDMIEFWKNASYITEDETALLIVNLINAANKVANTAGTYGYFMKKEDPRATKDLTLERSKIIKGNKKHEIYCDDANCIVSKMKFDIVYLDPPYTWRHYGAYYHIPETIAVWDKPNVKGKTGLRPWQNTRSRYCDRSDATKALSELVDTADTKHIFLSYNAEGLIQHEQILEILSKKGSPKYDEVDYRRYKSNNGGNGSTGIKERLYYVNSE